jgi:hypothetical protein
MGRLTHDQEQFFYSFRLVEAVPDDHPVREIAAVLDLSWVHSELAPYYPRLGRPSIDPVLMIRMLIVGYVFGIRSDPAPSRRQALLQLATTVQSACRLRNAKLAPPRSAGRTVAALVRGFPQVFPNESCAAAANGSIVIGS